MASPHHGGGPVLYRRGVHPPEVKMHFPLVSKFPLFPKNFSDSVENFPDFTFSDKIFRFSSAKISDDLFKVIDPSVERWPSQHLG